MQEVLTFEHSLGILATSRLHEELLLAPVFKLRCYFRSRY